MKLKILVFINIIIVIFDILDIIMNREYKNNLFEIIVFSQLTFLIIDKCERDDA